MCNSKAILSKTILVLALLLARAAAAQQHFRETHQAMGTVWTLELYAKDEASASQAAEDAWDAVDRIDDELSNYKPASELERVGRDAGAAWLTTDPETFTFLDRSIYWSRASHGAFDITVGPLLRTWGFFFHGGRVPSDAELAALREKFGWQNVMLDAQKRAVHFRNGQPMDLDPGSIGKGFAVDRAVEQLRADGITSALLSAGGSTVYAIGTPPNERGWPVTVPDARKPGAVASTVRLHDESLSTGACTEKFFIAAGHRYCHIFDPQTMRPVDGRLQTTVIDRSATDSDALSTVAFVLPPQEARAFFSGLAETKMLLFTVPGSGESCIAVHWESGPCTEKPSAKPHRDVKGYP